MEDSFTWINTSDTTNPMIVEQRHHFYGRCYTFSPNENMAAKGISSIRAKWYENVANLKS